MVAEDNTEVNNMGLNLAFIGNNADSDNSIKQIPLSSLRPYRNHKFTLYSGERFSDMVLSIEKNGILNPIIVRPMGAEYEILSGHNRTHAAKYAGLAAVPAVIKTELTDEEAEIYVIETNLIQRGFSDLAISEQAAVVAMRYSEMFHADKVEKIRYELHLLSSGKMKPSEMVGAEYGLSDRTISRLIRIHSLNESLKEWVDSRELSVRAGVELSFLPTETQECLYYACVSENDSHMHRKIDIKTAERIRADFENHDDVDENSFEYIFAKPTPSVTKCKVIKVKPEIYSRYFKEEISEKEVEDTIEKALKAYFKKR
jgi:ParB family chromosome partitioning protein